MATRNHEGTLYTAGKIAGIAPAIAVGVYSGATAGHTGTLLQTARGLNWTTTVYGTAQSGYNIATGQATVWDAAAVIAPASAGASRFFKWVQCFEAETPVAVDWINAEPEFVADGNIPSESTIWLSAAGGLLVVSAWPRRTNGTKRQRQRRKLRHRRQDVPHDHPNP